MMVIYVGVKEGAAVARSEPNGDIPATDAYRLPNSWGSREAWEEV